MKLFIGLLAITLCQEMLITREKTEKLKATVDWEVQDYENNVFHGWTIEEFDAMLGYIKRNKEVKLESVADDTVIPLSIDWSKANCDHGVKNQGSCGSCWAFAIVGMLSYRCCAMSNDKGWLSPQELVSCDDDNYGCRGGDLFTPIDYIKNNKGLVPDECFPYKAKDLPCPTRCADGSDWSAAHVCNCARYLDCDTISKMKHCLVTGPATFGFDVEESFMYYKSGIYKCDGNKFRGRHAVVAMGYSDTPECHYVAKNSWGNAWGDKGYFKIACNTCEIDGGIACERF